AASVDKFPQVSARLFSLRQDFPRQWHNFWTASGQDQRFTVQLGPDRFPYRWAKKKIELTSVGVLLVLVSDQAYDDYAADPGRALPLHVGAAPAPPTPPNTLTLISDPDYARVPHGGADLDTEPLGPLSVVALESDIAASALDHTVQDPDGTTHHRLASDLIDDVLLFVTYRVSAP